MPGPLDAAKPICIIGTHDHRRTIGFYRETLELKFLVDDGYAAVFEAGGITIRLSTIPNFSAHEHTVLGFDVADIKAAVQGLAAAGVRFNRYPHFTQDENGIWSAPDGRTKVAWFNDPDGNVLSVTQF